MGRQQGARSPRAMTNDSLLDDSTPLERPRIPKQRRREIIGVGLMAVAVIVLTTLAAAYTLYEVNRRNWMEEMRSISLVLAEHAEQTLFSGHTVLNLLTDDVDKRRLKDEAEFRAYASGEAQFKMLIETTRANPVIDVATFVAVDGKVLNFTRSFPAPEINLSDRDYFKAHSANSKIQVFTSVPVRNKGNGKWVFYLSQRVNDPQGRMLGLVLVGISVEVFAEVYERVAKQLGPEASVALYRDDFTLMTRWPLVDSQIGKVSSDSGTYQVVARDKQREGAVFTESRSALRGDNPVARLVAPRSLSRYPFIVTPVVPESVYLQNWLVSVRWVALTGLLSLGLVGLGMRMLLNSANRSARELAQRLDAEASLRQAHEELEDRVIERTADLRREIADREQAQQELARVNAHIAVISHRAGMSAVANSVLHNVGNVLNSINVSTTVLADLVKRTPLNDLPQAVSMLRPQTDEAPAGANQPAEAHDPEAVIDFLEMLSTQWQNEQRLLNAETSQLRREVDHIRHIVSQQQSLSGHSGLLTSFKPCDVINDALAIHQDYLQRSSIEVVPTRMDTGAWTGDRNKLLQIVLNLVVNSEQALTTSLTQKKRILVSCQVDDVKGLQIAFTDNGVGMPPSVLNRLFTYGFTTKPDGHGFGLHASALAAQEMGGKLSADSKGPGLGATFTIHLPAGTADTATP